MKRVRMVVEIESDLDEIVEGVVNGYRQMIEQFITVENQGGRAG